MTSGRDARDIAEEGLDKIIEGDEKKGRRMIDKAKKRDPKAVEDLAPKVAHDREQAERCIKKVVAAARHCHSRAPPRFRSATPSRAPYWPGGGPAWLATAGASADSPQGVP
jgi:hypothetical protein